MWSSSPKENAVVQPIQPQLILLDGPKVIHPLNEANATQPCDLRQVVIYLKISL